MNRRIRTLLGLVVILASQSLANRAAGQFGLKDIFPGGGGRNPTPQTLSGENQEKLLKLLGESNDRLAVLRKDMEGQYHQLHVKTLQRVEGLFYPSVESYSNSLVRIREGLPELQVVRAKVGEVIEAHVPTTSADTLEGMTTEISKVSADSKGRLDATFDDVVRVLAKELSGDQQVAYIRSSALFASNMTTVHAEWRTFGPEAQKLIDDSNKKRKEINNEFIATALKVTTLLQLEFSLGNLLKRGGGDIEKDLLGALGVSAAGQAPEAVKLWLANRRFWKGFDDIQKRFDGSFKRIGEAVVRADEKAQENRRKIQEIADKTNSDVVRREAERAIAYLRQPVSDGEVSFPPRETAPASGGASPAAAVAAVPAAPGTPGTPVAPPSATPAASSSESQSK